MRYLSDRNQQLGTTVSFLGSSSSFLLEGIGPRETDCSHLQSRIELIEGGRRRNKGKGRGRRRIKRGEGEREEENQEGRRGEGGGESRGEKERGRNK